MAIEHARICGACERECPGWAVRCPACGSLSLLHRLTVVPAAVVAPSASLAARSRLESAAASADVQVAAGAMRAANDYSGLAKPARRNAARGRSVAGRESKPRKTPLSGEPETRAV